MTEADLAVLVRGTKNVDLDPDLETEEGAKGPVPDLEEDTPGTVTPIGGNKVAPSTESHVMALSTTTALEAGDLLKYDPATGRVRGVSRTTLRGTESATGAGSPKEMQRILWMSVERKEPGMESQDLDPDLMVDADGGGDHLQDPEVLQEANLGAGRKVESQKIRKLLK